MTFAPRLEGDWLPRSPYEVVRVQGEPESSFMSSLLDDITSKYETYKTNKQAKKQAKAASATTIPASNSVSAPTAGNSSTTSSPSKNKKVSLKNIVFGSLIGGALATGGTIVYHNFSPKFQDTTSNKVEKPANYTILGTEHQLTEDGKVKSLKDPNNILGLNIVAPAYISQFACSQDINTRELENMLLDAQSRSFPNSTQYLIDFNDAKNSCN